MKRVLVVVGLMGLVATGCKNPEIAKLNDRIEALEKKVEGLGKVAPAAPAAPPAQETAHNIPVGKSPILGNANAKINVVIFSDFQCPFCSKTDPFLHDIVKDAELKDKVNVVFKNFPLSFHNNAKPAAKAALAAQEQGNDKFWAFAAKAYQNQQDLTPENFKKWAKEINLDVKKFEADLKSKDQAFEDKIKADMDLGMNDVKIRGTPSIFVGGWDIDSNNYERTTEGVKKLLKDKKLL